MDYSGTLAINGLPVATVNNIQAGSFDMIVNNTGGTSLAGVLKIGFMVL
jgi:hypothetical protein